MQKILILGANGNLGQQLVQAFKASYAVIAWDKEDLDIIDKSLVEQKIKSLKPEIIINAAAYNAVDKCEDDEQEFMLAKKINGYFPGELAKVALKINAVLIHYSTDYVFSGKKKEGYLEADMPSPISNYGKSKLLGEELILEQAKNGLKYYIIRTSKLFGPKGIAAGSKESFFDLMLKLAKENKELKAVNEEISCFAYTPDLAKATLDLIKEKKDFGIYHIANNQSATWHEAAQILFKLAEIKVKLIPVLTENFPRPAKRPKYSVLLNTKIKPLRSYENALEEYLSLRKNNAID